MGQVSAQGLPLAQWASKNVLAQKCCTVHDLSTTSPVQGPISSGGQEVQATFCRNMFLTCTFGTRGFVGVNVKLKIDKQNLKSRAKLERGLHFGDAMNFFREKHVLLMQLRTINTANQISCISLSAIALRSTWPNDILFSVFDRIGKDISMRQS